MRRREVIAGLAAAAMPALRPAGRKPIVLAGSECWWGCLRTTQG